jgi:hypothetical protein
MFTHVINVYKNILSFLNYIDWYALSFFILFIILLIWFLITTFFIKLNKKYIIKIIILCFIGLFFVWYTTFDYFYSTSYYDGSENLSSGEWCDYGYNPKKKECCDEDDYTCEICSGFNYDYVCDLFSTQENAQDIYDMCSEYDPYKVDIFDLDGDKDGIACENLLSNN